MQQGREMDAESVLPMAKKAAQAQLELQEKTDIHYRTRKEWFPLVVSMFAPWFVL